MARMDIEKLAQPYKDAGFDDVSAYAKAYRDAEVLKLARRELVPLDDKTSQMPLIFDLNALSKVRPDQVPRWLGAITNPEMNPKKRFKFEDLIAIQNRVDTAKVSALSETSDAGPAGIVATYAGKNYILDGHHRIVGRWLKGDADVEVYHKDLEEQTNAMKAKDSFTMTGEVRKIDTDKRLVYGWASVVEVNGEPVIDHHGDIISEAEIVKAAHEFMRSYREGKYMHSGGQVAEYVESMVFTHDVQKALGIDLGRVGWFVGAKVLDDEVWKDLKSGKLKMFSIGGTANRIDNVQ